MKDLYKMSSTCPRDMVRMDLKGIYGGSLYEQCPICKVTYMIYGSVMMPAPILVDSQNIKEIKVNTEGKLEITYQEE